MMVLRNLFYLAIALVAAATQTCKSLELVQRAAHAQKTQTLDSDLRLNLHKKTGLEDSRMYGGIYFETERGSFRGITNPSFAIVGEDVVGVFRWLRTDECRFYWYSKIAFSSMPLSKFRAQDPDWHFEFAADPRFQLEDKDKNAECSLEVPPNSWGAEDPRLFTFREEAYMSFMAPTKMPLNGSTRRKCPKETGFRVWTSKITARQPLSLSPAVQLYTDAMYPNEKAWTLFPSEDKLLALYSVYPHKILDVNLTSGYAPQLVNTSSPLLENLARSLGILPDDFHGGAGVALAVNTTRREPYFLSAVHYHYWQPITTSTGHCINYSGVYWSYLYAFRAQYPFDIIAVAKTPLPLQIDNHSNKTGQQSHDSTGSLWWMNIAYISSMIIDSNDLIIGYGQADRDARILRQNMEAVESALFDEHWQ